MCLPLVTALLHMLSFSVTFTAWCSYASTILRVVILSVCHTRAWWQNQTMHCGYFDTARKCNHSSFLTPTVVAGRCPLPSETCAQRDLPHFEKRRLRQISAYKSKDYCTGACIVQSFCHRRATCQRWYMHIISAVRAAVIFHVVDDTVLCFVCRDLIPSTVHKRFSFNFL